MNNELGLSHHTEGVIIDVLEKEKSKKFEYIHKGIRNSVLQKTFQLEQNIEVTEAKLDNGMLTIELLKRDVENKIKRYIEITEE